MNGVLAQSASSWRAFKNTDGLAESACLTVSVSPQGHVLVTHPNSDSVSVLDGYSAKILPLPQSALGHIEQSAGGQLWAVTTNGLFEFRNGKWISHRVQEIAVELRDRTNSIPLYPLRQSRILFLLHDRLMEFSSENPDQLRVEVVRTAAQSRIGFFSDLKVAHDGQLWISGERGLAQLSGTTRNLNAKSEWKEFVAPPQLELKNLRAPEPDREGGVIALAQSNDGKQNAVVRFDGKSWNVLATREEEFLRAWRATGNSYRAATSNGLFQLVPTEVQSTEARSRRREESDSLTGVTPQNPPANERFYKCLEHRWF